MVFIYFDLLTWYYSDSSSTWSPPQLSFLLNRIPHPWTFLCSDLIYSSLDFALLRLKVLTPPLSTRTPLQFRPASSIFFSSLPGQLTRSSPEYLIRALSDRINVYPTLYVHTRLNFFTWFFSRSDFYLPDRTQPLYPTSLPDHFPIGLLTTWSYPTTLTDFLTWPGYPPMHIPSSRPPPCNILWCNIIHQCSKPEDLSTVSNPHRFGPPTGIPHRHCQKEEEPPHLHTADNKSKPWATTLSKTYPR
jgi:hypothetical protein